MQTKKTTMLAAVLAVAIIALAGAGYATQYSATTTNTGNTMGVTYLTMTQSGTNSAYEQNFLTDLLFDSANSGTSTSNSTTYTPVLTGKLANNAYTAEQDDNNVAKISKDLVLNITPTGTNPGTINLAVKVLDNAFSANTLLTYTMVISGVASADYDPDKGGWFFENLSLQNSGSTALTVFLVVKLAGNTTSLTPAQAVSGFPASGTGCTFEFKATASASA